MRVKGVESLNAVRVGVEVETEVNHHKFALVNFEEESHLIHTSFIHLHLPPLKNGFKSEGNAVPTINAFDSSKGSSNA